MFFVSKSTDVRVEELLDLVREQQWSPSWCREQGRSVDWPCRSRRSGWTRS
jgi:hypothetical protein